MRHLLYYLIIFSLILGLSGCNRKVCPAYQSNFLMGEGDAELYFSYFSPFDSLPKNSGIFRNTKKNKNGLVKKKVMPTLWAMLSRSDYENRYNFPKIIGTKNYVPDTTGMAVPDDASATDEEKPGKRKKNRRKQRKKEKQKEQPPLIAEGGMMDEGSVAEDLSQNTNTVSVPTDEQKTEKIAADSLNTAQDSAEIDLKFADQILYELRFGDPNETPDSLKSEKTKEETDKEKTETEVSQKDEETDENSEATKKKRGLFGRKRKKKRPN